MKAGEARARLKGKERGSVSMSGSCSKLLVGNCTKFHIVMIISSPTSLEWVTLSVLSVSPSLERPLFPPFLPTTHFSFFHFLPHGFGQSRARVHLPCHLFSIRRFTLPRLASAPHQANSGIVWQKTPFAGRKTCRGEEVTSRCTGRKPCEKKLPDGFASPNPSKYPT
jgi:hypothetical protein